MPHFTFYEEPFEEMLEMDGVDSEDVAPPDNYEKAEDGSFRGYESASAQFTVDDLEDTERRVYYALQERAVTAVRCSYDGGGDEGFAHFEAAIMAGEPVPVTALAVELAGGPLGEVPEDSRIYRPQGSEQTPRDQLAQEALDDFAFALASRLLGDGFGTGEYSMYGAFEADFSTGNIVDDPNASDPYPNEGGPDGDTGGQE